jgi:hypothetical protein
MNRGRIAATAGVPTPAIFASKSGKSGRQRRFDRKYPGPARGFRRGHHRGHQTGPVRRQYYFDGLRKSGLPEI